jgi:hypothetical protein
MNHAIANGSDGNFAALIIVVEIHLIIVPITVRNKRGLDEACPFNKFSRSQLVRIGLLFSTLLWFRSCGT